MALKIRMRQHGRSNRQVYRVVVTDIREPRDGKYLEAVGWYNPYETEAEKSYHLDAARIDHWVKLGAEVSDNVKSLLMKTAPEVIKSKTAREVAKKDKARAKRKEKAKTAKAAAPKATAKKAAPKAAKAK